jgi:hypothetical protein
MKRLSKRSISNWIKYTTVQPTRPWAWSPKRKRVAFCAGGQKITTYREERFSFVVDLYTLHPFSRYEKSESPLCRTRSIPGSQKRSCYTVDRVQYADFNM